MRSWSWGRIIPWTIAGTLAVWIIATGVPLPPRTAYLKASQALGPHQCEALTREGRRCRNWIRFGAGPFCWRHKPLYVPRLQTGT